MDFKSLIKTIAPAIATAIGTPAAGSAVSILSNLIFKEDNKSEQDIQNAILDGLPNATVLEIRKADQDFSVQMTKLSNEAQQYYLLDVKDARKTHGSSDKLYTLAYIVLCTFAGIMMATLCGGYEALSGGIQIKPETLAVVSGIACGIVGYAAAIAQQVIGYYFGSSAGSSKKTDAMTDAMTKSITN